MCHRNYYNHHGKGRKKARKKDKDQSFSAPSSDEKLDLTMKAEIGSSQKWRDELRVDLKSVHKKVSGLESRITIIEQQGNSKVTELANTVRQLEQAALSLDTVIKGVVEVEKNDDDLRSMLSVLFNTINCGQLLDDIVAVRRLGRISTDNEPAVRKPRSILVTFKSTESKIKLLTAKKKVKITCADILMNGTPIADKKKEIFIDERLSKVNSDLFYEARQAKSAGFWKYAWVRGGNVYVKKEQDSKAIMVTSKAQLSVINQRSNKRTRHSTPEEVSDEENAVDVSSDSNEGSSVDENAEPVKKRVRPAEDGRRRK